MFARAIVLVACLAPAAVAQTKSPDEPIGAVYARVMATAKASLEKAIVLAEAQSRKVSAAPVNLSLGEESREFGPRIVFGSVKAKKDAVAKAAQELADLKADLKAERYYKRFPECDFEQGSIGTLPKVFVSEIAGKDELVAIRPAESAIKRPQMYFWVTGLSTENLVTDKLVELPPAVVLIRGTRPFETRGGFEKVCPVAIVMKPDSAPAK